MIGVSLLATFQDDGAQFLAYLKVRVDSNLWQRSLFRYSVAGTTILLLHRIDCIYNGLSLTSEKLSVMTEVIVRSS